MPSHGSLTKAGKVRSATPKIPPKPRKSRSPRMKNKIEHFRREVMGGVPWKNKKSISAI
ncbi:MAG: 30S ribosomal protein S30e [Candidatus Methanomethylicia archaeon]|nr:30S ribosomal protein S30e [Candidatus Methanomethylicia archaeon]MCX8169227.1 30S ribosomal protein S30e [Candidatus Methanomethylicia archaeon]MDW7988991.1 30S ribosomal protein S30e [Nitrososphaerota archaeon]